VVSLNTFLLAPAVLSGVGFNFGINASYSDKPAKKTLKVLSLLASGVILAPVLLSASVLMGVSHVLSIPNSKIESTFLDDCLNIYQEHKSKFDSM